MKKTIVLIMIITAISSAAFAAQVEKPAQAKGKFIVSEGAMLSGTSFDGGRIENIRTGIIKIFVKAKK